MIDSDSVLIQDSLNAVEKANPVSPFTVTVEAFLRSLVGKNRSPATIRAYRADLIQFTAWLAENNDVLSHPGQVTKADIAAYLSHVGRCGVSGVSRAEAGRHPRVLPVPGAARGDRSLARRRH